MEAVAIRSLPSIPVTLDADGLMRQFLSGKSERTILAYRQDLEDFWAFVGATSVNEAARSLLALSLGEANSVALAYRTHLLDRRLKPATVNRRLASLRSLVTLARTLGMVTWTLEVKNERRTPYKDTRGPGTHAFREMLALLAERGNRKAIRDRAILRLLFDLALRRGEVAALDLQDLDLQQATLLVLGKGHREKLSLTLAEPTRQALAGWVEVRGADPGPLFLNLDRAGKGSRLTGTSIFRMVRDLGRKVGVAVRPHGLRHTAITEACKAAQTNGMGIEEVLDFSRHADVKTLMVYRDRERNVQGRLASMVAGTV